MLHADEVEALSTSVFLFYLELEEPFPWRLTAGWGRLPKLEESSWGTALPVANTAVSKRPRTKNLQTASLKKVLHGWEQLQNKWVNCNMVMGFQALGSRDWDLLGTRQRAALSSFPSLSLIWHTETWLKHSKKTWMYCFTFVWIKMFKFQLCRRNLDKSC